MINVKALNKFLTENADQKLYRRWFLITPTGSLLAYTSPTDIRELRDQVGLVAMTWKEQSDLRGRSKHDRSPLHTLTLEFDNRNILVRMLQPRLLLGLEGGVPPGRSKPLKVTVEGPEDQRYPPADADDSSTAATSAAVDGGIDKTISPSAFSQASTTASTTRKRVSVLEMHRKKLDAMAHALLESFKETNFVFPSDHDEHYHH